MSTLPVTCGRKCTIATHDDAYLVHFVALLLCKKYTFRLCFSGLGQMKRCADKKQFMVLA
jgi:hypothetical protein